MIALDILTDGFFAAIAGIGFGAISDPPLRAFKMIASSNGETIPSTIQQVQPLQ